MARPDLVIIGDRINPGFKSTAKMIDANDIAGIQALAVRQREAGADYLDFTIGPRGLTDHGFLVELIQAVQEVVDTPLCFDDPSLEVQRVCLEHYDPDRAGGAKPVVNSIAETRWELAELSAICPVRFIMMSSEREDAGVRMQNKTAPEMVATVKRMAERLLTTDSTLHVDDLIADVAVTTLASDTDGMVRNSLEAVRLIGADPDLRGIHMSCGLTNLANQLPDVEVDGQPLKLALENSFLTIAVGYGFDMVMATPWRDFELLSDDNTVLRAFKEIVALDGLDALRRLRELYRPQPG